MDDWIVIGRYNSVAEAYIAKGLLDSEGIPANITNATISSIYPMTETWTPIEILVPNDCVEKALALLHS